jgi:hypothetical protein
MKKSKLLAGVLSAAVLAPSIGEAAVVGPAAPASVQISHLQQVQHWRGGGWRGRPYWYARPWARRPYYGTIVAGVALGTLITVAAVGMPPRRPAPNLCWYWSDPYRSRGYWDYC